MAERKLIEVDEIFEHIYRGDNFLLSGGAGSGKTYCLVEVLKRIYTEMPKAKVASITFTRVAAKQVKERAPFENLRTSTIHEFLWYTISPYQGDLKKSLLKLISDQKIDYVGENDLTLEYYSDKTITYDEWKKIAEGIISHDEVIIISEYMFATYPLLSDITKDKYDFILIDEYQDTFKPVVEIFLNHLQNSKRKIIIGLFGDSMQSIYREGIGDDIKTNYVDKGMVKEVIASDNRRNPKRVIDLANKIRTDRVIQRPADDENAPNFKKEGVIKFLYSDVENLDIDMIKRTDFFGEWNFDDKKETKELYLTHNLIAPKAGFPHLMQIYDKDRIIELKNRIVREIEEKNIDISDTDNITFGEVIEKVNINIGPNTVIPRFIQENPALYEEAKSYPFNVFKKIYLNKDQLIGDRKGEEDEEGKRASKRDDLIKHLFNIQKCIFLYNNKMYNEFIRQTKYEILSVRDKIDLKKSIEKLSSLNNNSIEDVINFADESKIWPKDDRFNHFIQERTYVYNRVKLLEYQEFVKLFNYVEEHTPYSTQHNIKGAQFNNVLVVLDNGGWRNYNFKALFEKNDDSTDAIERTRKIFYVCCTRAKENLVVLYHKPTQKVIARAKEWFGENNVHSIP